MKYRYLGNSGLAVSTIGLGTMTFGQEKWGSDEATSIEILNSYIEEGGNFIDTASQYTNGKSESIIGKWLSGQNRDDFILATKCGFQFKKGINNRGLSRKNIIATCERSLKRLKTDYIDLYQIYGFDPQTPIEETLLTLDLLVRQGKVRYIGFSNLPSWKLMKAQYLIKQKGLIEFISGQYLYNLLKRDIETEIIPACNDQGIGVICWSPLSGGMLTGKYSDNKTPIDNSRLALRPELSKDRYESWFNTSKKVVEKLREIADSYSKSIPSVALAWLLKNKNISSVIVGARNANQIKENCIAGDFDISNDDWLNLEKSTDFDYGFPRNWIEQQNNDWFNKISQKR